jgi:hypothetical protein
MLSDQEASSGIKSDAAIRYWLFIPCRHDKINLEDLMNQKIPVWHVVAVTPPAKKPPHLDAVLNQQRRDLASSAVISRLLGSQGSVRFRLGAIGVRRHWSGILGQECLSIIG